MKGTASLTLQISPTFLASGSFTGAFNAVAVSANLGFSAALNTRHFTAQGNVSGTMLGVQIALRQRRALGQGHRAWSNVRSFPPQVDWIGSNINQMGFARPALWPSCSWLIGANWAPRYPPARTLRSSGPRV